MKQHDRLKEVRDNLDKLRSEEMRLAAARFKKVTTPQIKAAIGKTFVYRNNSSGGTGRWDTFRRLRAVEFSKYHAWLVFEECSLRADDGRAEISIQSQLLSHSDEEFPSVERGWVACGEAEYEATRALVLKQLENPTNACEYLRSR